jgi:membrane-bound serine protease (ClpP class)
MAVRHRRIRTGSEGMLGHIGVVRSWDQRGGKVLVDGALWHARAQVQTDNGHEPHELHAGDSVVVEHVSGLTITVRPAEEWELLP